MNANSEIPETFSKMGQQQLEIYARELYEHFQGERRLRGELEERNRELQQHINELTALNKLFHQFLDEYFALVESYGAMANEMERFAREAGEVALRVKSYQLPDVELMKDLTQGTAGR